MRIRTSWLIILGLVSLLFAGCNGDDVEFPTNGSDPILKTLTIGNTEVQVEGTYNIPLDNTFRIRFETARPITEASLADLLEFEIRLRNVDTGITYLITDANMLENGDLVFLSNSVIEYRLYHGMGILVAGGEPFDLGQPGNTLLVEVQFLTGKSQDGTQFSFINDSFSIVWTDSNQSQD